MQSLASNNAWVVMHRPLWGVSHFKEKKDGTDKIKTRNATLQAASGNTLPSGVKLVLSGHIHFFQWLSFEGGRQPQLTVGNSGTKLESPITESLAGVTIGGASVASGATIDQFGYLAVEPSRSGWSATLYSPAGATLTTCTLQGVTATCSP